MRSLAVGVFLSLATLACAGEEPVAPSQQQNIVQLVDATLPPPVPTATAVVVAAATATQPPPAATATAVPVPPTNTAPPPPPAPATAAPVQLLAPTAAVDPRANCEPAYPTICIAKGQPDLDCGDIPYRRFTVLPPDPHRFDGSDNDGIGCESG